MNAQQAQLTEPEVDTWTCPFCNHEYIVIYEAHDVCTKRGREHSVYYKAHDICTNCGHDYGVIYKTDVDVTAEDLSMAIVE